MKPMPKPKKDQAIETARRVLKIEAEAVSLLREKVDVNFTKAVRMILSTPGKVVLTGIGKSGIVCQKIASTLASTGTSAFFLHPAEGAHGEMGVIAKNDILIAVSNSGESEEIIKMLPAVKRLGVKLVAMTGRKNSTLARHADVPIDIGVKKEACPMGLAPTASTTAALAMGDALAVALLTARGFKKEDFAMLHPAGHLGWRLTAIREFMRTGEEIPSVTTRTHMRDAILEMSAKRLGITGVLEGKRRLAGVITDGDLRRALEKGINVFEKTAGEVMTKNPKTIREDSLLEAAIKKMEDHAITVLFVCNRKGDVTGIVHMHDLIKEGMR